MVKCKRPAYIIIEIHGTLPIIIHDRNIHLKHILNDINILAEFLTFYLSFKFHYGMRLHSWAFRNIVQFIMLAN